MTTRPASAPAASSDFASAFPSSRKVFVEGPSVSVPMREVSLSGGEPPLRLYDTSGPQGHDVAEGLPPLRQSWILDRAQGCASGLASPSIREQPRSFAAPASSRGEMPARLAQRTRTCLRGTGPGPSENSPCCKSCSREHRGARSFKEIIAAGTI